MSTINPTSKKKMNKSFVKATLKWVGAAALVSAAFAVGGAVKELELVSRHEFEKKALKEGFVQTLREAQDLATKSSAASKQEAELMEKVMALSRERKVAEQELHKLLDEEISRRH
jgi:hypothetical protein